MAAWDIFDSLVGGLDRLTSSTTGQAGLSYLVAEQKADEANAQARTATEQAKLEASLAARQTGILPPAQVGQPGTAAGLWQQLQAAPTEYKVAALVILTGALVYSVSRRRKKGG